jgi:hypothetical protein
VKIGVEKCNITLVKYAHIIMQYVKHLSVKLVSLHLPLWAYSPELNPSCFESEPSMYSHGI